LRCQRQILQFRWFDFIWNADVTARTELPSLADTINRRRLSLFGHVALMDSSTLAHDALNCAIARRMEQHPLSGWKRPPGRPAARGLNKSATVPQRQFTTNGPTPQLGVMR